MSWKILVGAIVAFAVLVALVEFLALSFVVLIVGAIILAIALAVYAVMRVKKHRTEDTRPTTEI